MNFGRVEDFMQDITEVTYDTVFMFAIFWVLFTTRMVNQNRETNIFRKLLN